MASRVIAMAIPGLNRCSWRRQLALRNARKVVEENKLRIKNGAATTACVVAVAGSVVNTTNTELSRASATTIATESLSNDAVVEGLTAAVEGLEVVETTGEMEAGFFYSSSLEEVREIEEFHAQFEALTQTLEEVEAENAEAVAEALEEIEAEAEAFAEFEAGVEAFAETGAEVEAFAEIEAEVEVLAEIEAEAVPYAAVEEEMPVAEGLALSDAELFLDEEDYDVNVEFQIASIAAFDIQATASVLQAENCYYYPTAEELLWAYFMAYAEAGIEDGFGQTLVTNVAINRAIRDGKSLVEVYTAPGQFSSVVGGIPTVPDGHGGRKPVTEDMLSEDLKASVAAAFQHDFSEDILRIVAEEKGLDASFYEGGALYFYNPAACGQRALNSRAGIQCEAVYGRHHFYKIWG